MTVFCTESAVSFSSARVKDSSGNHEVRRGINGDCMFSVQNPQFLSPLQNPWMAQVIKFEEEKL